MVLTMSFIPCMVALGPGHEQKKALGICVFSFDWCGCSKLSEYMYFTIAGWIIVWNHINLEEPIFGVFVLSRTKPINLFLIKN